ncbi:MAG: family 20 glycosylhydrolase [Bacteroidales bacterium]|nr:family 20 glycosylhydrolase [Bacteroidales bacterium]
MRKISLSFLFIMLMAACTRTPKAEWTEGPAEDDGRAMNTLVLQDVTKGSRVWFQELFDSKTIVEGPAINHYQGTSWYIDIPNDGTVTIKYYGRPLPRQSWAPEGFVMQRKGKPDKPMQVNYHFIQHPKNDAVDDDFICRYEAQPGDIIPQVKRVKYGTEPLEKSENLPYGWYRITIDENGEPKVEADDEDGAFYARTTLEKLQKPLQPMTIEDWPDNRYRGFMLDVARDFRSVDEVLKVIDLMAQYKFNVFHFHIGDDEAWCLEIKDLPDLTDFSGHHALPDWNLQETEALKPTANGRINNKTYFTGEEYKQILRYAWERHISVIPEFDAPGHSRASIKAMQAYEKRTGDASYRLQDPADTSHYWSAQDFTDNVLSVYLPSVYTFYGIVFDEVIRLHEEANVPLLAIHIGGDEVPNGAWANQDRKAMKDLFTNNMLELAEQRGIRLAGWEDIAKGIEPETVQRLKQSLYFINIWTGKGMEGFPCVLSPATNNYVDLAYSADPEELGLFWAGFVDERKTFSMNPKEYTGDIVGVSAHLWSEQLRKFDDVTFQMLPKALGVAERAWNTASPSDFNHFYSIIVEKEMPIWEKTGYKFKKRHYDTQRL